MYHNKFKKKIVKLINYNKRFFYCVTARPFVIFYTNYKFYKNDAI